MGCASSKKIGATSPLATKAADVYRPPPTSFSLFDINSVEEPWLKLEAALQSQADPTTKTTSHVPTPLLEKLDADDANAAAPPRAWDEISKALHDFKTQPPAPTAAAKAQQSFHTVEELAAKKKPAPAQAEPSSRAEPSGAETALVVFGASSEGYKSVRENPFIVKDKMERGKEGKEATFERLVAMRRDPLGGFPEKCPPGGEGAVLLYTTSLRGVRKTFEECKRARSVLEIQRVVFDERDVALHGKFLGELRELLEEDAAVPRLFIHGRYIGGVEELVQLNESGRLSRILSWAKVERGVGYHSCEGCGGARFVPCFDCGGSCKVVVGGAKERCTDCNENGLAPCPLCH